MDNSILRRVLPIKIHEYVYNLLNPIYVEQYTYIFRQQFMSEYCDTNLAGINETYMKHEFLNMASSQLKCNITTYPARLILIDDVRIIGGCAIQPFSKSLELSYFVIPAYQNKGICYEMLCATIDIINKHFKMYDYITLEIQNANYKSIQLANKLNFYKVCEKQGKINTNSIFRLNIA